MSDIIHQEFKEASEVLQDFIKNCLEVEEFELEYALTKFDELLGKLTQRSNDLWDELAMMKNKGEHLPTVKEEIHVLEQMMEITGERYQ